MSTTVKMAPRSAAQRGTALLQSAVVGATGYAGFELTRLLLRHPRMKKPLLLSREGAEAGNLDDAYPQIANSHGSGNGSYPLEPFSWEALAARGVDVLFLSTPHEISRAWMPEAERRGLRVIDLSGAWRLRRAENRAIYKFEDADAVAAERLMQHAVYGLPEMHAAAIADAQIVANPGCYSTSVILGLVPLARGGWIDREHGVIADSKSGVSGAGKAPTQKTHFVEVADNLSAYNVFAHRHTGEMLEQLGLESSELTFTPHLLPIPRGILSTIYVRLAKPATVAEIHAAFRDFYAASPFVRVFAPGRLPQIQHSAHTNFCDVGFTLAPDGRRLVVVSCLDNLLKGAAGQAVQNMNLMFGFDEREGLQ
ncbi:MAG TPA: N-acetyl-gamma-glutamyl-phosphate reductase [Terriglobales bacterium]|nr:N-acetyl-gamma-glutamyl-phosphate reductase [Terriglobales bacterium]